MQRSSTRADLIGRQVGRYTVVKHLASGGMAELYVARQEAVGGFEKHLVLKLLQAQYTDNPRVVEMFLDEARLAAKLNHPSIVHVYDVAEDEGVKYIAMEHIHGETLTDIIRRGVAVGNYLPLEHGVHIISQTAAGLAYAHGRHDLDGAPLRIVHRDVSPSNILVSYEGQTKIVDFGIARIQDQIREESGMRPGKASYMSPEQVAGEGADNRSDIFSLGIILYEISLGRRLFRGPGDEVMRRIVEEKIAPPTSVRRDYPPALELIVMKALEKRPADRYQSAEEMRNDLEEFVDEVGFRTGPRRMALYLKQLFAPGTPISDRGVAEARLLADGDSGPQPVVVDESEELNFDRRTSFAMRVEAAPASPRSSPSQPLPTPLGLTSPFPMGAGGELGAGGMSLVGASGAGEPASLSALWSESALPGNQPPRPESAPTARTATPARTTTLAPVAEVAPEGPLELPPDPPPVPPLTPPLAPPLTPPLTPPLAPPLAPPSSLPIPAMPGFASETSAAVAAGGRAGGSNAWLALTLLILLGIGAMVFIVLR